MTFFQTYIITLFVIFAIYFAIMVIRDLSEPGERRKKTSVFGYETQKADEDEEHPDETSEVIPNISEYEVEDTVCENNSGEYDEDDKYPQQSLDDSETLNHEKHNSLENLEKILAAQAEFNNPVPVYQDEYYGDDFEELLRQPLKKVKIRPLIKQIDDENEQDEIEQQTVIHTLDEISKRKIMKRVKQIITTYRNWIYIREGWILHLEIKGDHEYEKIIPLGVWRDRYRAKVNTKEEDKLKIDIATALFKEEIAEDICKYLAEIAAEEDDIENQTPITPDE